MGNEVGELLKGIASRYAVVCGTAWIPHQTIQAPWYAGRYNQKYTVTHQGGIHTANSMLPYNLQRGDLVIVERNSTQMTIVARMYGDSTEGTPYQGTGGIMSPHDAMGTAPGTAAFTAGYWELDTGPGIDGGVLHP